ncbi:MAG: response regulator [Verrucomicrobia bacterium]|nr:MAG: response regulator [Verrucomicrobiota bacterium]
MEREAQSDCRVSRPEGNVAHTGTMNASRAQALYQSLFELMPGSVVLLNARGVVLDANPSFCRQIGYAREELLGRHVSVFSKDSRETIERNLARLLAGEVLEHVVSNIHKDGSLRHYELRETAIRLPDGARGILALSNDITRRVNAEQEKLELQRQFLHAEKLKSLGLMAGGIAHDFNNLLAVIVGNIEMASMELPHEPGARAMLREAVSAANRAAHLTRQMLAYSGRGHFVVTDVDLNETIRGTTELLNVTVSKKASLEFRLDDSLPLVKGDAAQLQQVVMNLVTNASEALADQPGLITVSTSLRECDSTFLSANRAGNSLNPGSYAVLEVSDTGCGMEESVQQQLFDPFFTTKFVGRGLGMSATLGVVRGHDGGILVSSRAGRGTTMTVLFPAGTVEFFKTPSAQKHEPAANKSPMPALTGTVLVVDDEAIMRSMIERVLKRTGLRVILATHGWEAVSLFQQHADEITFVLLDLSMPKLDGMKTLAELRRHRPEVKAVLTSGYNEASICQRSVQEGFVAFIPKPYQAGALIELARRICAGEL